MTRNERGLTESVQYALLWPVLVLVTLGIVEAGLWLHGRNVVQRAAVAAVDEARGTYGTTEAAREVAEALTAAGGLSEVDVQVSRGAAQVDVVVTARAPLILDVGLGRLRETASAPRERVSTP